MNRLRPSFLEDLLETSRDIDIHVVPSEITAPDLHPHTRVERPNLSKLAPTALLVALTTGLGFFVAKVLDLADVVVLYMLCITIAATRYGRWAALLTCAMSVAALDFFFIPPRFTFVVQDMRHVGTFGVMLIVGWIVAKTSRSEFEPRRGWPKSGSATRIPCIA
jgi:two-component system sensor histidine kinase KdpD